MVLMAVSYVFDEYSDDDADAENDDDDGDDDKSWVAVMWMMTLRVIVTALVVMTIILTQRLFLSVVMEVISCFCHLLLPASPLLFR